MKVVERDFEHRIQYQVKIDDMQFGFMPDKGWSTSALVIGN